MGGATCAMARPHCCNTPSDNLSGSRSPAFARLDDLSSDGVTGRIDTVSVSQRHKSHLEGDTHGTSSLGVEPKAVTLVKEAFENSHGC